MARVLLVYANPAITTTPVPPYGMERVARAFALAGCAVDLLTPFDEPNALTALHEALAQPTDLVGFSVRNLDDALIVRSELGEAPFDLLFYLDLVRPLVQAALERLGPERVLLGGSALGAGPVPVLRYLGAPRAIRGVAEDLCWGLGRRLAAGLSPELPAGDPRVVLLDRDEQPLPHRSPPLPRETMAALPYLAMGPTPRLGAPLRLGMARGAHVPVQISVGCDRRCHFCVESRFHGGATVARPVPEILEELRALADVGVSRVWLSGSELNVPNAQHAKELLRALQGTTLELGVFLTAAPVDEELLDLLEGAGISPSSLSFELGHLDDRLLRSGAGPCNRAQIDALVELFLRRGLPRLGGCVLLGAHPGEDERSLASALDAARQIDRAFPDGFALAYACGARVYPETRLADLLVERWEEVEGDLYTLDGGPPDPSFVRPVVYCRPTAPRTLLTRVRAALAGARGPMGPMNSEAPEGPAARDAERLLNRGLLLRAAGDPPGAIAALRAALDAVPGHTEALSQLAQLQLRHDPRGARHTLARLQAALSPDDPRQAELRDALAALPPER